MVEIKQKTEATIKKKISVIVPVCNEEHCVAALTERILAVLAGGQYDHELLFIDDGSRDGTIKELQRLSEQYPEVRWIHFSRNFGHQAALKAGLDYATGDCVISMDGDMQHPPELLPQLIEKWEAGYDIVYTRRKEAGKASGLKYWSSVLFYRILNSLADIQLEAGVADFRLTDRKVTNVLVSLEEVELFFRGLVKWVGFKSCAVDYVVGKRYAGRTKYSVRKMMQLAVDGITSFSTRPLYLAIYVGIFFAFFSMLYFPYALWQHWLGNTVSGWTSLIMTIVFFGGLQLLLLGVVGIYISKIFRQSKKRPIYIIESVSSN